jgi:hypothetical protein
MHRTWLTAAAPAVLAVALAGCGGGEKALSAELARYTDAGDGCQQAVSAIAYADASLKSAGQERYQDWDDETRSKVGTVSGTIALEVRDFPSEAALEQARRLARVASEAAAQRTSAEDRVHLLRDYRREAAQLVVICGRDVPEL